MIEIRPATLDDCQFVARCIGMALHIELPEERLPGAASICARENVLYSYRHALIAWEDNKPLGLCLAYDGNNYHEIRLRTFALFAALDDEPDDDMDLEHAEDETQAGEYYIDSLAVLPEYRRRGIAILPTRLPIRIGLLRLRAELLEVGNEFVIFFITNLRIIELFLPVHAS